jgi:hypothetical protein
MPSVRFEPTIQVFERLKTVRALHRATTGTGPISIYGPEIIQQLSSILPHSVGCHLDSKVRQFGVISAWSFLIFRNTQVGTRRRQIKSENIIVHSSNVQDRSAMPWQCWNRYCDISRVGVVDRWRRILTWRCRQFKTNGANVVLSGFRFFWKQPQSVAPLPNWYFRTCKTNMMYKFSSHRLQSPVITCLKCLAKISYLLSFIRYYRVENISQCSSFCY